MIIYIFAPMKYLDTIVALATPPGSGAIAVVRLSGPEAISLAHAVLHLVSGKAFDQQPSHTVHLADLIDGQRVIDQVLATIFVGPKSYTGDDVVELSCHGSVFIQQAIIQLFIDRGARMANPGEFTLRAFLHGKMDLSQAEAVADLIASDSAAAHQLALNQMRGGFSQAIALLREELMHFASMIELELDFAEEDVEFANRAAFLDLVQRITAEVKRLIDSFALGQVLKEGVPVALVGPPNAGKSTLLNALLNDDRAIVSAIAGTTRDTIEDELRLGGVLFRLIDTAGLRETRDLVEGLGIEKTYQKMAQARVVVHLFDGAGLYQATQDWSVVVQTIDNLKAKYPKQHILAVVNKGDLLSEAARRSLQVDCPEAIALCAKDQSGVETLKTALTDLIDTGVLQGDASLVSNGRHYHALIQALEALDKVQEGMDAQISGDLLSIDLRMALHALGEITGAITTDDLLGHIFANFCIGK